MFLLKWSHALEIANHFAFVPSCPLAGPPGPRVSQQRLCVPQPALVDRSSGVHCTHLDHVIL
jgi:hypothetical protein